MELSESKNGVIFDILFHLLAEMSRGLKMWCKVESPCYQGSGSCALGIILVNFAGADEQWPLAMVSFWWECKDGKSLQLSNWVWLTLNLLMSMKTINSMTWWLRLWQGEEVSWYSFIGNLNLGRHDAYEAQTISKTKTIRSMCFIHNVGTHQNALPLENA